MLRIATTTLASFAIAAPVAVHAENLYLSGSTTLIPIVSNAADAFMNEYETWDAFDDSLPNERIVIETSGGGSGQGVRSVLDGVASAGMVARELSDDEKDRLGDHEAVRVGIDAVAIAAHQASPLHTVRDHFSGEELADIFSGEIATFSQFDSELPETDIVLLVRDSSAGSAVMIQNQILENRPVSPNALQMNSQGQLVRTLEGNTNAFAYISLGLVNASDELTAFAIGDVEASSANVVSGDYTLARPMYIVHQGDSAYMDAFMEYLLGPNGQSIVEDHGYISVADDE